MADDFRLNLDPDAVAELADRPEAVAMLEDVGEQVADRARELAPKVTGAGAASIQGQVGSDDEGAYADVSWDQDHFYMGFAELGTEHQPPTPFLRPALDQARV